MIKLICDRCGIELTEKSDIDLALEGMNAWRESVRARGMEPRGVFPCEHYVRCGGEMIAVDDNIENRSFIKKLFRHQP